MNLAKRRIIFTILKKSIPNAKTELNYASPFQLLIAVILSAQATDTSVNKATKKLFIIAGSSKKLGKTLSSLKHGDIIDIIMLIIILN